MTPSMVDTASKFETLPDELLIDILTHDLETIPRLHQKTLTQMCLTSKRLYCVAHEILLARPYVRLENLDLLRAQYQKYLDLASKVNTVEMVSPKERKCLCSHDSHSKVKILQNVSQLESLFTTLPHLDTLLLGSNHFSQTVPLQMNFLTPGLFMCPLHGIDRIHHYGHLSPFRPPTAITEALARLRVLELPVDWDVPTGYCVLSRLDLRACTSLEHLTIPTTAIIKRYPYHMEPWNNHDSDPSMYALSPLPQFLLKLTLSRNGGGIPHPFCEIETVMRILALRLRQSAPRLTHLEVWSRSTAPRETAPIGVVFPRVQQVIEETVLSESASIQATGINVVIHYENSVIDSEVIPDLACDKDTTQDQRYIEYDSLVCRGYFKEVGIWGRGWHKIRRSQYRSS